LRLRKEGGLRLSRLVWVADALRLRYTNASRKAPTLSSLP
jgi:hypothetical protein